MSAYLAPADPPRPRRSQSLAPRRNLRGALLTSGFCYERAEDAEARFAETQEGYTYSRVGNPTVRMLEERMALLEGSEDCAATASGMAAVHAALMCQLRVGHAGRRARPSCSVPATGS